VNISEVNIGLKGEDLESIIKEFLDIKELKIYNITINNDEIIIKGNFEKVISLDFEGKLKIKKYNEGKIEAELSGFKVSKLKIANFIRKVILKFALKTLSDKGIIYNEGKVIIDIKKLLLDVPYVDFDINDININNNKIYVEANNITVSINGLIKKEYKEEVEEKVKIEDPLTEINKVKDGYTKGREFAMSKLPNKVLNVKDHIFILPDIVALIYRLLKDKRVPIKTKLIIAAAVSYIAFPTDLIPDRIPFIGTIDEIGVAFFAINRIITDVEIRVILENWEGKNDIIFVMKNLVEYIINFTGAKNVEKVYNFIDEVVSV